MAANERPDADAKDAAADAAEPTGPVVSQEPDRDATAESDVTAGFGDEDGPVAPDDAPRPSEGADAGAGQGSADPLMQDLAVQTDRPSSPPAPSHSGSNGFVGMVVGGVVAAAIGYGVAIYAPFGGASDLPGQVTALKGQAAALTDRVTAVETAPAPILTDPALEARVAALEAASGTGSVDLAPVQEQLSDLAGQLATLEARLSAVESRPVSVGGGSAGGAEVEAALAAMRAELDFLKGAGAAATAEIEAIAADAQARLAEAAEKAAQMKAEAEATAQKAMTRAGLGRIQAALESGAPFEAALTDLGEIEVPAALHDAAATGIPSRAALEEAFPVAARAALEASLRANTGESWSERIGAFLQSTTGARSLTPREGNDPDAILSRAEAALKADDLPAALTELAALPAEGQAAMADWVALATQRISAAQAVADLSAAIDG